LRQHQRICTNVAGGCSYIKHSEYSVILHAHYESWQLKRLMGPSIPLIEFLAICVAFMQKIQPLEPESIREALPHKTHER
jgi:hypothetical protein